MGDEKEERKQGECGLTHIEQRLQHRSSMAPTALRNPRSGTQPPLQPELQHATSLSGNNRSLSNTAMTSQRRRRYLMWL